VRKLLREAGEPLTTRQVVESIRHHYAHDASARNRLHHYLARGIVEGVEYVPDSRPARWRLVRRKAAVA
jgi:hypothetical protein